MTNSTGRFSVSGLDWGHYDVLVDADFDGDVDDATDDPTHLPYGVTLNFGTFTTPLSFGPSVQPTNVTLTTNVGRARLRYQVPPVTDGSYPDHVHVAVWPVADDVVFSNQNLQADARGLMNGVTNRFAVRFGNSLGRGPARVLDAVPPGCQYLTFTDVTKTSAFCDDIRWLVYAGIGSGYDDSRFRPTAVVTRQAVAAFLYRFAGSPNGANPGCSVDQFDDVPETHPFCGEIQWLVDEGIASGYGDDTFRGTAPVSRQAMAAFLYRFAGSPNGVAPVCSADQFDDVPETHPFCGEIRWLLDEAITSGYDDGTFRPGADVSRQAIAAFLQRLDGVLAESAAAGGLGDASESPRTVGGGHSASELPPPPMPDDGGDAPKPVVVHIPLLFAPR
jgi:hypothetical protein